MAKRVVAHRDGWKTIVELGQAIRETRDMHYLHAAEQAKLSMNGGKMRDAAMAEAYTVVLRVIERVCQEVPQDGC